MAIGLTAYSSSGDAASILSIGGFLGLLINAIVSMGAAGFVAGYLSRFHNCFCHGGVLYGFITWCLALILSIILILPMIHYVSFQEENLDPNLVPMQISAAGGNVSVNSPQDVSVKKLIHSDAKHLAGHAWILFIIFFLGALSSCISACCGMCCGKEDDIKPSL